MITNTARRTGEIKSKIGIAKAAFDKKKTLFTRKLDLHFKKKLVKCHLDHGCVWYWNFHCILRKVIEGKIGERKEVTRRRRRRRRKRLLDDIKEKRGYWKLKVEALDRTLWRSSFARGCEPTVRKTTEWMRDDGCLYYGTIALAGVTFSHAQLL